MYAQKYSNNYTNTEGKCDDCDIVDRILTGTVKLNTSIK